jgi:Bacterial Ig-like domain (group 1)
MLLGRRSARAFGGLLAAGAAALSVGCSSELPAGPRLAAIAVAGGDGQTGVVGTVLAAPLTVKVEDQYGDPIDGAVVVWAVTTGNGVVDPVTDTTDASGTVSTSFRLGGQLGVQTASALLPGLPSVSFVATATPGPPAKLAIAGGDGQSAATSAPLPVPLQVLVTDGFNNPLPDVTVAFTVLTGGGTLSAGPRISDENGIARTDWTLGPIAGTQTVLAGFGNLTPVTFAATALSQPGPPLVVPRR